MSPELFRPQHLTVPPLSRAQEWSKPALTATAYTIPLTEVGTELMGSDFKPVPSLPEALSPQHLTTPPRPREQVLSPPVEMALTFLMLVTSTGVMLAVVVRLPS